VVIQPPPGGGAASAILALEHLGSLELRALPLPTTGPIRFERELDRDDTITLRALLYDETLEELGIAEGALPLIDAESDEGRKLPPNAGVLGATIDGDLGVREWEVAEMGPALTAARIPVGAFTCTRFDLEDLTGELDRRSIRATEMVAARDRLLVFASDRRLYAAESDRFFELGVLTTTIGAATVDRDGAVWLASSRAIQRAVIGPSAIEELSPALFETEALIGDMKAGVEDGEVAIYVAVRDGSVLRHRAGAWSVVASIPGVRWTRIRWIEPDHVMLIDFDFRLFDLRGGELSEIYVDQGIGVYDVVGTPGFGPVIGTSDGRVLAVRDEGFEALIPEAQGFVMLALERYKAGVMFILSSGFTGEVQPRTEPCALIQSAPILWGASLYNVGGDLYGTALATVDLIPILFRLTPR
jgi:hypothetical protein